MGKPNKITILCGHYGCGKTNLALNLAIEASKTVPVTLVDMDIVNPYFRSSEYGALLSRYGVKLIQPVYANTTLDTPTLPPEIQSVFGEEGRQVFIDAGGDDAGMTALGGLSKQMADHGYDMLYVVNRYRVLSQSPEAALQLLQEIEAASHLKATGVVNNSHMGVESTLENVIAAQSFGEAVAAGASLPLCYSTVPDFVLAEGVQEPKGYRRVQRLVRFPWEEGPEG